MPADPFDLSTADPNSPGLLGQPVSFWQNLARFGGNLAAGANARTAGGFLANGTGLAGPLGAAIGTTMEEGNKAALQRSQLNLQGAEAARTRAGIPLIGAQTSHTLAQLPLINAQTQQTLAGIPLTQAQVGQTQAQTGLIGSEATGKNIANTLASFGIAPAQAQAEIRRRALTEPGFLEKFIDQLQGGGGVTGGPSVGPQSQNAVPPDQRGALVAQAVGGTPVPPAILHGLIDYETGGTWDPTKVNQSSGAAGLPQALASTAASPGFNTPPIDIHKAPPDQQAKWAAQYLAGRGQAVGVKDWSDPAQVTQALIGYHGPQKDANGIDGQMYAQQVLRRAATFGGAGPRAPAPGSYQVAQAGPLQTSGPTPPPQQQPGSYTPAQAAQMGQQFLQDAAQINRRADARMMGTGLTGIPMGDPAAMRTDAQQTRAKGLDLLGAGPLEAAKAGNSNIDARPGAILRFTGPNGQEWYKAPIVEQVVDSSGATHPMHVTPPMPGEPEGTQGTATPIVGPNGIPITTHLPPNLQGARTKAYEDFAGRDADSYVSSKNTQGILTQMNEAADVLNKNPGFLSTGPLSPLRLGFASRVNDIMRTAGLPAVFDPNTVGMWEELTKQTRTAGFELASHYEGHARQAASTILNATSAVPAELNSPVGFYKVSHGINEIAQQNTDAHEYLQSVYDNNGDLSKANTDFYTKFPGQMYARRAISAAAPYPIKKEADSLRYLPGTYIKLPNGKISQVPEREGAPPIPDYIKQQQFSAPTDQTKTAVPP
jgi:hypothetical protein